MQKTADDRLGFLVEWHEELSGLDRPYLLQVYTDESFDMVSASIDNQAVRHEDQKSISETHEE